MFLNGCNLTIAKDLAIVELVSLKGKKRKNVHFFAAPKILWGSYSIIEIFWNTEEKLWKRARIFTFIQVWMMNE